MASTRLLTFPASAAFLRRFVLIVVSAMLTLLVAGSAFASIGSTRPIMSNQQLGMSGLEPGELPDVALLIGGPTGALDDGTATIDDRIRRDLLPALSGLVGVESVATEPATADRRTVYVSIAEGADSELLATISATVAEVLPDTPVLVGGRAVADRDLLDRLNRSLLVAVGPVVILLLVLVAASVGTRYGLAVAASISLSTLFAGLVGSQSAGRFDGSLATTAVPAVLSAVLVSTVLGFRLLEWFKHPQGDDQAESIRRAVRSLLPELSALVAGLVVTAVLLETVGVARTPAIGVAVGAIIASVITFALLPAMLAMLPVVPDEDDYRLFRLHLPDGRDVPTPILAGFGVFLLSVGLFATSLPTGQLLDESALPSGVTSRRVAETLQAVGGDPTSALVARIDDAAGAAGAVRPEQVAAWARTVSDLPAVGWVETSTGRYVDGAIVVERAAGSLAHDDTHLAIITPNVSARSVGTQELGRSVASVDVAGLSVSLDGVPADAARSTSGGGGTLLLLVVVLSLAGAAAALVLTRNLRTGAIVGVLRLVGVASALGVYHVVVGDGTMAELQTVALIVSVGVSLFELGLLRRITRPAGPFGFDDGLADARMTDAIRREGRAGIIGLSVAAACGMGFLASDLEVARRLGVGLAAALIVELLVGTWLLRPALLGHRLFYVSFREASAEGVRLDGRAPERVGVGAPTGVVGWCRRVVGDFAGVGHEAIAAADGRVIDVGGNRPGGPEMFRAQRDDATAETDRPLIDPQWRRVVQGLLRAEFSFQNDPANAELSTVFVEDTPVYAELLDHNQRLRSNGFRVVGRGPRLVKARCVDETAPITIAITVDHPERRLIDRDGRLLGVRRPERREGMLWLAQDPSGRYRIAEAVDLGSASEPVSADLPTVAPNIALSI